MSTLCNPVIYVVIEENTLGYLIPPWFVGILSSNHQGYDWKNGPMALPVNFDGKSFRLASLKDFDTFRVAPPKYMLHGDMLKQVEEDAKMEPIARLQKQLKDTQNELAAVRRKSQEMRQRFLSGWDPGWINQPNSLAQHDRLHGLRIYYKPCGDGMMDIFYEEGPPFFDAPTKISQRYVVTGEPFASTKNRTEA